MTYVWLKIELVDNAQSVQYTVYPSWEIHQQDSDSAFCLIALDTLLNLFTWNMTPRVVPGYPFPPFFHSLPYLLLFLLFPPFVFSFALAIFFFFESLPFIPESSHSLSRPETRRRRPYWGLVCSVHFMLSVVKIYSVVLLYLVEWHNSCLPLLQALV